MLIENKNIYSITDNHICLQMGADIDGGATGDYSGHSVSLSSDGTIIAIGAKLNDGTTGKVDDNRGHVRVYKWDSTSEDWEQMGADIDGENAGDESGWSVSLSSDGTTLAIGAKLNDGTTGNDNRGHVRVYEWDSTLEPPKWVQMGADIDGEADYDESGRSVSLSKVVLNDGSTQFRLAIGAPFNDENGKYSGHVRVYEYRIVSENEWTTNNIIKGDDTNWTADKKYWVEKNNHLNLINCIYKKPLPTVIPKNVKFVQNKVIPGTVSYPINSDVSNAGVETNNKPSGIYNVGNNNYVIFK